MALDKGHKETDCGYSEQRNRFVPNNSNDLPEANYTKNDYLDRLDQFDLVPLAGSRDRDLGYTDFEFPAVTLDQKLDED